MKGYLTFVVVFLALCTAIFVTACAENSGWGASYGGIQPDQTPTTTTLTEPPPGSGSVPYVHEGPF